MPRWFFKKSIKVQLTVVLFGLTAISIVVVGFLGIRAVLVSGGRTEQTTTNSMKTRVEQFLVQTTAATAAKNSVIFKNVQAKTTSAAQFTANVFSDQAHFPTAPWRFDTHITRDSNGKLNTSPSSPSTIYINEAAGVTPQLKQNMESSTYLDNLLPGVLKSESNAVAVYYVGPSGETRYYPNINLPSFVPDGYNAAADIFFAPVTPQNDPAKIIKWSSVYNDPAGNGLLISASQPFYDTADTFRGIIGLDVSLNDISKNIEDYSPIESSYSFLVDNTGRAIALPSAGYEDILGRKPKKDEFGPDLKNVHGNFASVIQNMRTGKKGYTVVGAGTNARSVAYAPVEGTPFSVAIVAKQTVLLAVVGDLRSQVHAFTNQVLYYQILPIAAIILLLVWIFGFFYIRLITGPLIMLTDKTKQITQGNFRQVTVAATSHEVGKLTVAFNQMARQLAESYQMLEQKVMDRTQALDQKVRELSNAKAKDEAILESIGEGMVVTDDTGGILLINVSAALLLGLPHKDAIGKNIKSIAFFDETDQPIAVADQPVQEALHTGHKVSRTVHIEHSNKKKTLYFTITPVRQRGKIIGTIQIIRDVTKEKEIDRMKTEFISIASHQLRTPLSAIKWYSEMMLNEDVGKLSKDQHDFIADIASSTERMIELVSSLLNISRLESGRIIVDPKPTDLSSLVKNIINDLKAKTHERHQSLKVTVDKSLKDVSLDPKLVGQVYLNLLTNAIKYTPAGGHITVTIARDGKDILSCISDDGYGIPKDEQVKVFKKFFRATNIIKVESDGTGLGMYLVKSIVETSGGKIWFESQENKGTTFWFTLPADGMKAKAGEVVIG